MSGLVVIINETIARRYWPGEDPIGKGIKGFDSRGQNDEWVRVIGVVTDMHSIGLDHAPIAQIYETQAQSLDETESLGYIPTCLPLFFACDSSD